MPTNPYISQSVKSEQNLYEDLVIESLKFYGQDVYYIPREIVNKDKVFLDDVPSRFTDAYKVEMYIENVEGWQGEGDLFTKFGIELRDQATFVVARRRWKKLIGDYLTENNFRPREGDVIYTPLSESIWQITKVETETPFYQLSQLPTFRLQCELFEYSDEDFDTGIDDIDIIEYEGAYQYALTMHPNDTTGSIAAATVDGLDFNGGITGLTVTHAGAGYDSAGAVVATFSGFDSAGNTAKFGENSINMSLSRGIEGNDLKLIDSSGFVEYFLRLNAYPTSGQGAMFTIGGGQDGGTKQYIFGVGSGGGIVYSRADNEGDSAQIVGGVTLSLGSWNHIGIGQDSDTMYMFINGSRVTPNVTLPNTADFISGTYSFGAVAARDLDGISYGGLSGHIDEIKVSAGTENQILASRYSGDSDTITVPTVEHDSDSRTSLLEHANGTLPTVTAVLNSSGGIGSLTVDTAGFNYNGTPTVSFNTPVNGGNFATGQIVTQVFPTYTMKGEVTDWSDSDRVLQLAHVGATDGKFHEFNTTRMVTSGSVQHVPSLVTELQEIQNTAQNKIFDDFEGDFLDFSESNPFGDMS